MPVPVHDVGDVLAAVATALENRDELPVVGYAVDLERGPVDPPWPSVSPPIPACRELPASWQMLLALAMPSN